MKYIAGIFIADDMIIWAVAERHPETKFPLFSLDNILIDRFEAVTTPRKNLHNAVNAISEELERRKTSLSELSAMTIASLGPFHSDEIGEPKYGRLRKGLRKSLWSGFDLISTLTDEVRAYTKTDMLIRCMTDAEAVVTGESYMDFISRDTLSARAVYRESLAALCMDEGVGGSVIRNGRIQSGQMHSESGHMRINRHRLDMAEANHCDAHSGDCLEGLASLRAIRERWNLSPEELEGLDKDHKYVRILGFYLGQALANMTLYYTPTRICLHGRLFDNPHIVGWGRGTYENLLQHRKQDFLYPGYDEQQNSLAFIQAARDKDMGIIGCLVHSQMSLRADNIDWGTFEQFGGHDAEAG